MYYLKYYKMQIHMGWIYLSLVIQMDSISRRSLKHIVIVLNQTLRKFVQTIHALVYRERIIQTWRYMKFIVDSTKESMYSKLVRVNSVKLHSNDLLTMYYQNHSIINRNKFADLLYPLLPLAVVESIMTMEVVIFLRIKPWKMVLLRILALEND